MFGLQIAKAIGAEVIVLSGSGDKLRRAIAMGASHGIDRHMGNRVEAVYRITGDAGIDHILEIAGGAILDRSIAAVAVHGRISVIGVDGFELSAPTGPLLLKSPTIQGVGVGHRRAFEDFVRAVDRVGLPPMIDAVYSLERLADALDHLDRRAFGKVVIDVKGTA